MASKILGCAIVAVIFGYNVIVESVPVESISPVAATTTVNATEAGNGTHQELYVVKVSTYEVGILANVPDNETENDYEDHKVHQQVDLTFYDAETNNTHINLGNIPVPVQTNVSGEIITGVAPIEIGAVQSIGDALKVLPFSGTIVNITNSDTSYVTVDRKNTTDAEQQTVLKDETDLAQLPILNNVLLPDSFKEAEDDAEKAEEDQKEEQKKP